MKCLIAGADGISAEESLASLDMIDLVTQLDTDIVRV